MKNKIIDYTYDISDYGEVQKYTGANATINAIKNLILSREGNYPFTPKAGIDIGKYQFDLLDDDEISKIKHDIMFQVTEYIPSIDTLNLNVQKVEEIINNELVTGLGVHVSAVVSGENIESSFLLIKDKEVVQVYNENQLDN